MLRCALRLTVLAALTVAATLTVLTVRESDVFRECVGHAKHTESAKQHKENTTGLASRAIARLKTNWICSWEFVEKRDKPIVAFFTIVLAGSTILLWLATQSLFRAGERQMRFVKQSADAATTAAHAAIAAQRAWVFAGPILTENDFLREDVSQMTLMVANFGKTPAVIKEAWGEFSTEEPLAETPTYRVGEKLVPGRHIVTDMALAADKEHLFREKFACGVETFFFGYVRYADVFSDDVHTTRFCIRIDHERGRFESAGHPSWRKDD